MSVSTIDGHPYLVNMSPPDSHFSDLNIIGSGFCGAYRVVVVIDYLCEPQRAIALRWREAYDERVQMVARGCGRRGQAGSGGFVFFYFFGIICTFNFTFGKV